ncbi:DUF2306 domain-containing protein [Ideonella sp. A 288]|uniref:DUF2306 domain-containing protein n=1 Tax=Ideonella sp. A 288 TaxID=1962181 RepID=UPI00130306CE|nr:DUF2306 domain-containing protein [Ideonella sp. A 288]
MTAFSQLLDRNPLVFFHLVTAIGALLVGIVVMTRRKGTGSHRALGWAWVLLMSSTTLASAFIRDHHMINLAGITPIHAFTLLVSVNLPRGIWAIRQGNVALHQKAMRGMFIGGCVVAGLFTLLPGRFLGGLLWQSLAGIAA